MAALELLKTFADFDLDKLADIMEKKGGEVEAGGEAGKIVKAAKNTRTKGWTKGWKK